MLSARNVETVTSLNGRPLPHVFKNESVPRHLKIYNLHPMYSIFLDFPKPILHFKKVLPNLLITKKKCNHISVQRSPLLISVGSVF